MRGMRAVALSRMSGVIRRCRYRAAVVFGVGCLAGVSLRRKLRAAGASGSERACTSVRGFGAFRPGSLIRRVLPLWAVLNLES